MAPTPTPKRTTDISLAPLKLAGLDEPKEKEVEEAAKPAEAKAAEMAPAEKEESPKAVEPKLAEKGELKKEAQPAATPTKATKLAKRGGIRLSVNLLPGVAFFLLVLAGAAGWAMPWYLAQNPPALAGASDPLSNISTSVPPLPSLKLNYTHARQGQVVEVDPNNIGKENPFAN